MGVLRMIKLFGWEHRVKGLVEEKRENELKWIWRRKLLGLANNCLKYVLILPRIVVGNLLHVAATLFLSFTWSSPTPSM